MKVKIILIVHILKRTSAVPPSGILSDENIYFALEKLMEKMFMNGTKIVKNILMK